MSWLKEATGGEAPPAFKEKPEELTEKDPNIPNRYVSNKPANRPFLAYAEYRQRQEALHNEWVKKKEERDAKIARGEKVGPLEPDPTAVQEVGVLGFLKLVFITFAVIALAGKFITGSYTWDYQTKWTQLQTYFPQHEKLFSEVYLAQFNGEDPEKPIYISIDGDVYDVSPGGAYQKGGSYHILAGKEGARAFATGCFKEHMTHDTRGLDADERAGLQHWKNFYANHKTYKKVGRLALNPIDPAAPVPDHCDPKKREADAERLAKEAARKARYAKRKAEAAAKEKAEAGSDRKEL